MFNRLQLFVENYFPEEIDVVLMTSEVSRKYLLNFVSSAGILLVFQKQQYFIVDFRYIEMARKQIKHCKVILQENLHTQIRSLLQKHHVKTCGVEEAFLTLKQFLDWKTQLQPVHISQTSGISNRLAEMRMIKTEEEQHRLMRAQQITDHTFQQVVSWIVPGRTERELALEVEYHLKKNGADAISFDTIVVAGINTSLPHGRPSEYALQQGDFVLMDFGATFEGYHADMTRTVIIGEPNSQQKEIYQLVFEAQQQVLDKLKAGLMLSDVDGIARNHIDQAGYKGCFGHSLGHGVGLEIHEMPNCAPTIHQPLVEGMVMTVEPGIYLTGKFGVRIEDMVIIQKNGCKNLTKSPKSLLSISS